MELNGVSVTALLAFYDFPAEHCVHLRTTHPIESTFAIIRHRTDQTQGCVTRDTLLSLIYTSWEAVPRSAGAESAASSTWPK